MSKYTIFEGVLGGFGPIWIAFSEDKVTGLRFGKSPDKDLKVLPFNPILNRWFNEYITGQRSPFPYELVLNGTDFQVSVWNALIKIPYGAVRTYKDVALMINNPNSMRAVGMACGANPIPIIIPCHRVVAANGIGGFSAGLDNKIKLLKIENSHYHT